MCLAGRGGGVRACVCCCLCVFDRSSHGGPGTVRMPEEEWDLSLVVGGSQTRGFRHRATTKCSGQGHKGHNNTPPITHSAGVRVSVSVSVSTSGTDSPPTCCGGGSHVLMCRDKHLEAEMLVIVSSCVALKTMSVARLTAGPFSGPCKPGDMSVRDRPVEGGGEG